MPSRSRPIASLSIKSRTSLSPNVSEAACIGIESLGSREDEARVSRGRHPEYVRIEASPGSLAQARPPSRREGTLWLNPGLRLEHTQGKGITVDGSGNAYVVGMTACRSSSTSCASWSTVGALKARYRTTHRTGRGADGGPGRGHAVKSP
ncbi:SBBP repeat-containing protein [Cystobacter ferrugineus]|uniref:SBBP repeat-containing protein n=1 Tax=Cystobacter ferrugineus TaxID=83449 RepID=UPI0009038C9B